MSEILNHNLFSMIHEKHHIPLKRKVETQNAKAFEILWYSVTRELYNPSGRNKSKPKQAQVISVIKKEELMIQLKSKAE